MAEPTPFQIDIAPEQLADLHRRLDNTRWPEQLAAKGDDWASGAPLNAVKEICHYWRHQFDWWAQQQRLNQLPQYLAEVEGLRLHFIHRRSPHPDAMPLVLTHGWPGSFIEFEDVLGPLTEPEKHGGNAEDAFHVICPSMPGYTFSQAPRQPGCNTAVIARIQRALVHLLGYRRYAVQGGDWGAMVSTQMARQDPHNCIGLHLNLVVAPPPQPPDDPMEGVSEQEMPGLQKMQYWQTEGGGYFRIQSTRPDTLGFGLTDSPAGLAAWIWEKFRDWSDCEIDRDRILTNISLYWFTGSITSAARLYYEEDHEPRDFSPIPVPMAGALFPGELFIPPRVWAEKIFNVQRWTHFDRGGHFAAMEVPDLLVKDIRAFFRDLR